MGELASSLGYVVRQPSFWVALALWIVISVGVVVLSGETVPLPIGPHPEKPLAMVLSSWIALVFLLREAWLVAFIVRRRPMPDLLRDSDAAVREAGAHNCLPAGRGELSRNACVRIGDDV
jgi:hypothetical protein